MVDKILGILNEEDIGTHSSGVLELATTFGVYLNLDRKDLINLQKGALFHDIGKTLICKEILRKPAKLTNDEFDQMKKHTLLGGKMASEFLNEESLKIVIQHHERIDGKGYPYGLKGEEIDKLSKIVSLCDTFDAIVSKRVYKESQNAQYAIDEISRGLGTQFDKEIGIQFIKYLKMNELRAS